MGYLLKKLPYNGILFAEMHSGKRMVVPRPVCMASRALQCSFILCTVCHGGHFVFCNTAQRRVTSPCDCLGAWKCQAAAHVLQQSFISSMFARWMCFTTSMIGVLFQVDFFAPSPCFHSTGTVLCDLQMLCCLHYRS